MKLFMTLLLGLFIISMSFGEQIQTRNTLKRYTNQIHGVRQNIIEKKQDAIMLCDMIMSLHNTSFTNAIIIAQYITLADPRLLYGRIKTPAEIFPAVKKLIMLGDAGATAAIKSVTFEQVNKHQLAINIAYVLSKTIGPEAGLQLLKKTIKESEYEDDQINILEKVGTILSSKVSLSLRQKDKAHEGRTLK